MSKESSSYFGEGLEISRNWAATHFLVLMVDLRTVMTPLGVSFSLLMCYSEHMGVCMLSHLSPVWLSVTPWTADCHAPLSTGFSRKEYWSGLPFPSPMHACRLSRFSHVWLCVTPRTAAHQPPLSMGFSRQEYWSGLPFPSPKQLYSNKIN